MQHSGLVHSARGRGTRVTSSRELTGEAKKGLRQRLGEGARTLYTDAKLGGLSCEEAKALMVRELESVWGKGAGRRGAGA